MAKDALKGVGDASLGEWGEWHNETYHLKRRLTAEEQAHVGEALDIRGTSAVVARRELVLRYLPVAMRGWQE